MNRKTKGDIIFDIVNYVLLILVCIACLYPLLHVLFASISDPKELMAYNGIMLKPLGFNIDGYRLIFKNDAVFIGYKNTLIYVVLGVAVNMVMTICGAFTLSRRDLYLKKYIMLLITITMFFGGGLIPWFLIVKNLGMYNNLAAMIIPTAINTWNMIIMRTGFQSIPRELEEAAEIDGAGEAYILFSVVLPLSKAVLAVIFLYYFVGIWNSWFNAMVFLRDRERFPLQLILREILVMNDAAASASGGSGVVISGASGTTAYRELVKYCAIVVATLPILCIYPFVQKYFAKGVYVGSIKG